MFLDIKLSTYFISVEFTLKLNVKIITKSVIVI